jgi:hypothetical protein
LGWSRLRPGGGGGLQRVAEDFLPAMPPKYYN